MKNILVFTDFSINADYAAHYALKLAQRIKANLLLCNVYEGSLKADKENSIQDLGELYARLNSEIDKDKRTFFKPQINQCNLEGPLADRVNEITSKNKVLMAVACRHDTGWLSTLISGNHTDDIIEAANFPVLIIPYQVRFKNYKTIAFATAMNSIDVDVLESLIALAKNMDSQILVTQVSAIFSDKKVELNTLKHFFNQTPGRINYPKILYRILEKRTVINSLIWLTTYIEIDLLVLVHRKLSFFQKLFTKSITWKMAARPTQPLLVFPYSND